MSATCYCWGQPHLYDRAVCGSQVFNDPEAPIERMRRQLKAEAEKSCKCDPGPEGQHQLDRCKESS